MQVEHFRRLHYNISMNTWEENPYLARLMAVLEETDREYLETGDAESAQVCQMLAVRLGTWMETRSAESGAPVSLLEEYCELLGREILEGEAINPEKHGRILAQLPDRSSEISGFSDEVVFLVWRAPFWQSYRALYDLEMRAGAQVRVMPIPYLQKISGEVVFEADDLPAGLPIVSYEEYDLAGIHPDRVYFQFPFDDENYVYGLDPGLYSESLREDTEELIYVSPYEVPEISEADSSAVQTRRCFIDAPGVRHADRIYAHSEGMLRNFQSAFPDAKDQIGLIPVDHSGERRAEQVGNRRKTVLFSISIGTIEEYREKALKKLEQVLRIFDEQRLNVNVVWYEDPSVSGYLPQVSPDLWERYVMIRENFLGRVGMYETDEPAGAVASRCDAYYGDAGPCLRECSRRGLPVMLMNVEVEAC